MIPWIIIGVILLLLIILITVHFLIINRIFNSVIKRDDTVNTQDSDLLEAQGLDKIAGQILDARDKFWELEYEDVSVTSFDDLKLFGILREVPNAKGTIILFHGYRSLPDLNFGIAENFYEELGFNVLLPYQRAHGRSEGEYITFGINERKDVHKWVEFINNRFGSQQPIILLGISMGATTVLMSAGDNHPDNVKLIISDCGFTSPHEIMEHVATTNYKAPVKIIMPFFDLLCKTKAGFSIFDYSTTTALKNCRVPVLFIHGEKDDFVPAYMSDTNFDACSSEKHMFKVANATHAVSYIIDKDGYQHTVSELINKYIA